MTEIPVDPDWQDGKNHPRWRAFQEIVAERNRQDEKWGEQNHPPEWWLAILVEEVGEFAEAIQHRQFGGPAGAGVLVEAVHVAAVAFSIVECCERNGWNHAPDEGGE